MGLNFDTMRLVVLAFVVLAVAAGVNAALGATQLPHSPFHGKKTLVLLDTMEEKQAFSIYFSALEKKGYELTFARADDASLSLVEFGEYLFDSLILFAPQTSRLGGGGGVDDVGYDASDADGDHSLLVADAFGDDAKVVVGAAGVAAPVLFRGIGHAILASGEDDDGVHLEVLVGSDFAYSHVPSLPVEEIPLTVGSTTGLVSAVQARNNARLVITGSLEMFSNAFLQASVARASGTVKPVKSGNKDFVL